MINARFVGTRGFLIRYEINILPIKAVQPLILTKHYSMNLKKKSKVQSIHYRNVSTDPLGTARGSLEIRGTHLGNQRSNDFKILK
jgi:hypothetical protein